MVREKGIVADMVAMGNQKLFIINVKVDGEKARSGNLGNMILAHCVFYRIKAYFWECFKKIC